VTNKKYVAAMDASIEDARRKQRFSGGPFRYGLLERWLTRSLEPGKGFKVKAPKSFEPRPDRNLEPTLREFAEVHDKVLERIQRAQGLHLRRVKVNSVVTPWLRFSLGQTIAMIAAHDRRHLWQAWQVRKDPAFPGLTAGQ
jgi:hypothetical protein